MALVALFAKGGNAGCFEHAEETGDLSLVRDARRDDRKGIEPTHRLVRERSRLESELVLRFVVEDDALAREPGRFGDRAIDALIPERAHGRAVGRWIEEGHG